MRIYPPDQEELRRLERDRPRPLTKAEIDAMRSGAVYDHEDIGSLSDRVTATLDALFAYREQTRGMEFPYVQAPGAKGPSDAIAAELGLE